MTEKTTTQKRTYRKKSEDRLEALFKFAREVEGLSSKYPSIPETLKNELNALSASAWKKFDNERAAKKDVLHGGG